MHEAIQDERPLVWVVVVGYNNSADSVECLHSLADSTYPRMRTVYVDNGSEEAEFERVAEQVQGVTILRHPDNVGVARGFNSGMAYALKQGADMVVVYNNDTRSDPEAIALMVERTQALPDVGIVIPKVYYYDHPASIWAAGSRYRRFPPAIVLSKTADDDDGRFDAMEDIEFAPYCVALFTRAVLTDVGLLDTVYRFFYEDYDLGLRARAAGYRMVFAPSAHIWHKISKTIKIDKVEFWRIYGRSHGIFCRKFHTHPYVQGFGNQAYLCARTLYEGKPKGLRAFRQGLREGRQAELGVEPTWDRAVEPDMLVVREA